MKKNRLLCVLMMGLTGTILFTSDQSDASIKYGPQTFYEYHLSNPVYGRPVDLRSEAEIFERKFRSDLAELLRAYPKIPDILKS